MIGIKKKLARDNSISRKSALQKMKEKLKYPQANKQTLRVFIKTKFALQGILKGVLQILKAEH